MLKYRNIKKACLSGHLHASKLEASYCNRLLAMKQKGEIKDYKTQLSLNLIVNKKHICKHIVDFLVVIDDDKIAIHETKGYLTQTSRIKRALTQALYPNVPYITIYKTTRRPRCQRKNKKTSLETIKIFH